MTPKEIKHEVAVLRTAAVRITERLEQLCVEIEKPAVPQILVCPRCKIIRANDLESRDKPDSSILKIGAQSVSLTPLEAAIMNTLIARPGQVITWDRLIFNCFETGIRRPCQRDFEVKSPRKNIQATLCLLRRKLCEVPAAIETRFGVGLIWVSELDVVLEAA